MDRRGFLGGLLALVVAPLAKPAVPAMYWAKSTQAGNGLAFEALGNLPSSEVYALQIAEWHREALRA
jgi:hypothetical protein